jgi:hypothetical protein
VDITTLTAAVNICITNIMTQRSQDITAPKRGRGRPASGGGDPVITMRMPADLIERARSVLTDKETISDLVRAAVQREIARRERKRD